MPTETADWVGLTLDGRYAVAAKLGEGGMGFVYRARDTRLNCDVVVKVPRAAVLEDPTFRERFTAEVGALVRLAHPHVVRVTDCGQHDGVPFAVMQFLPGGSLDDRRPKGADGQPLPVPVRKLARWLLPVAEALDFIHAQGYVHRDVKPANVLFDAHKNAYVSDFGVAKVVSAAGGRANQAGLTQEGMVIGTPTYMAPEMILCAKSVDGKIDQYALAVTVYELVAGRPPFDGPTAMAVLVQRTTEDPPPLAAVCRDVPVGLSDAVARALSRDPAQRFKSCARFARACLLALGDAPATTGKAAPPPIPSAPRPARDTPGHGVTRATPEVYGVVGPKVRPPGARATPPARAKPPALPATPADSDELWFPKTSRRRLTGGRMGLALALSGAAVFTAVLGILLLTARSGSKPTNGGPAPAVVTAKKLDTRDVPLPADPPAAGPATVTDLRPTPDAVELLAGGPWVPLEVAVERTGAGPVTVNLNLPLGLGVEARRESVDVDGAGPARFELRAAPAAMPQVATATITTRGVRRSVQVTVRRLDFHADLAAPGEVVLAAGRAKAVPVQIDRSGGYGGPLTITVPASAVVKAATVRVPAGATEAQVPLTAAPTAPAGTSVVHLRVAAADGGADHDLPVTVRVPAVTEVRSFAGHDGKVTAVALSPDGTLVVSGGADGTVRAWSAVTGQEKWKGEGHAGPVLSVALSPDGKQVVSGGSDKTVRVWDVATGTGRAFEQHHTAAVWLVRFTDAKTVKSVSGDKTVHWMVATGRPRPVASGRPDLVLGQKLKPDIGPGEEPKSTTQYPTDGGEFLVSGVGAPAAALFKRSYPSRPASRIPAQGPAAVRLLAAAGDGARVLTVTDDNAVRVWDTRPASAQLLPGFPWPADYDVTSAALDGTGRQALMGGANGELKLWKLP